MRRTRNLAFVIWMLGFPIANTLHSYVTRYLLKQVYSDAAECIGALIWFAFYLFVGYKLYEKKDG